MADEIDGFLKVRLRKTTCNGLNVQSDHSKAFLGQGALTIPSRQTRVLGQVQGGRRYDLVRTDKFFLATVQD